MDPLSPSEVETLVCTVVLRTGCKPAAVLDALAQVERDDFYPSDAPARRWIAPEIVAELEYATEVRRTSRAVFKIVSGAIRARIEGRPDAYKWLLAVANGLVPPPSR